MNHLSFQKPFRFLGKVQRFFRKALPLFLILAALSSCGKKDYAKMIPADAALVVRSNLKAVAEEAGGMEQLLKSAAASGNPLLAAVAGDPELCGIDPGEDVYLYASLNRDEPTLLFALADESRFEAALEELEAKGLCDAVQQGEPFRWASFPGQGLCAFADGFAVWTYAPLTPPESLLARLRELYGQDEKASFVSGKEYGRLASQSGNTRFFLSLETLPNTAAVSAVLGMPFQLSAEDIRICGSFSYTPAQASLSAELYSDNGEVQDFLERQTLDMHALSGKYFSYLPDDLTACIALRLDGDGAAKVDAIPEVGPALASLAELAGIDSERFLDSFGGDFVLGIGASAEGLPMPSFVCYAECAGESTRQILREALAGSRGFFGPVFRSPAPDQYVMEALPGSALRLGTKGSDFYLTTAAQAPFEAPARPLAEAGFSALRQGKLIAYLLFCPGNAGGEVAMVDGYMGGVPPLPSAVRAVELAARPGRKVEAHVYFNR